MDVIMSTSLLVTILFYDECGDENVSEAIPVWCVFGAFYFHVLSWLRCFSHEHMMYRFLYHDDEMVGNFGLVRIGL
jgi:hypothetical protein